MKSPQLPKSLSQSPVLPKSLLPWSNYLNLLATPLPHSLGPTIKCLDLVFGPSKAALTVESEDEPEGYDGIARKGTYERLVLSEWLLADEFPDEFLRRSSVGEHAFLELTRKSPSGSKTMTVLFDCGPNQLGSPRIAHLAVLIVLARRAELNNMELNWGVLQDHETKLVAGAGKDSIEKLLASRTVHEVTDKDISRWFETAIDKNVVIIGGARISKMMRRRQATVLTIEDVLEPEQHALSATYVASAGNRRSEFILPLPRMNDCVQILQNPFEVSKSELREQLAVNDWSVAASGEYFLLRQSPTTVVSLRVPSSKQSHGMRQRTYILRSNATVVASGANVADSAAVLLTISKEKKFEIVLFGGRNLSGYFTHHLHSRSDLLQQISGQRYLAEVCPSPDSEDLVWVHVGDHILQMPTRSGQVLYSVIADHVFWLARSQGTISETKEDVLVYAQLSQGRFKVVLLGMKTGERRSLVVPGKPMFCSPSELIIAYRDTRLQSWSFATFPPSNAVPDPIYDRQFLDGEKPIAVLKLPGNLNNEVSLVTMSRDRRDLHVISSGEANRWRLPQATSPIRSVAVNKNGVIAYITEKAELTLVWPDSKWQRLEFNGHRFQEEWRDDEPYVE